MYISVYSIYFASVFMFFRMEFEPYGGIYVLFKGKIFNFNENKENHRVNPSACDLGL
jgi:hypothetical protein